MVAVKEMDADPSVQVIARLYWEAVMLVNVAETFEGFGGLSPSS
jgi:hypothetical protein